MKKLILSLLVLGILAGGTYAVYLYFMPHENVKKMAVDETYTSTDLLSLFEADYTAADEKLKEKVVSIEGTISGIKKMDNQYMLSFDEGGDFLILAYFKDELTDLSGIDNDKNKVKFKGKYAGVIINDENFMIPADIKIENCYLLNE